MLYRGEVAVTFANGSQFGARATSDAQVGIYRNVTLVGTVDITGWLYNSSGGYLGIYYDGWNTGPSSRFDNFGGGDVQTGVTPPDITTINYTYDPLYRLTPAQYTGSYTNTIGYSYDAVGNRLTQTKSGTTTNNVYDITNRLTSVNGQQYTWDNNGNLLSDGLLTYTYDQANRLKAVSSGQSAVSSYAYNGVGDRLRQTANGVAANYAPDLNAGLTQVLADGSNTYLYGNGPLRVAQYQTAMHASRFGADGLGSVRQLYNNTGQVVANTRYDPFGNVISQSGSATSAYGFTGEQYICLLHISSQYVL